MIESTGRFWDNGDKFMLLEMANIYVRISLSSRNAPYVTIERSHIEFFKNEDDENDSRMVTDKIEKIEMPFWNAVIQETSELEKIEKARKA